MKPSAEIKILSQVTKEEWREYTKTVWSIANVSHELHPATFPVEIPKRLTKLFSFWGETVLDPFGGVGSTAVAAIRENRKAICIEQNPSFLEEIKRRVAADPGLDSSLLDARIGDSRDLSILENESVDLIITSPPYWDKADYGGSKNDIGTSGNYVGFLAELRKVFEECKRVLKPGRKMCVVTANVNQMTDHGLLTFPISSDIGIMLREMGLVMINEIIWSKDGTGGKWGSANGQRPIFGSYPYPPNFLFKNVHEYVIIFAKPSVVKSKGSKVRSYDDLMRSDDTSVVAE